ncbi:ABC transporter transmembrane domain-containing protein [Sulfitobacter geojensis]|uniref:Cyclic nucleotide-binding domain-containing protein n=1 Tax=Sulfitobacter geojensis TaxID=1342299 RepID=A0AAE2VZ02_9RHOB|nr:ABC transporter transmembrane domain-containing protein [Sulfitobacter geojensis]MBM1689681.1 cyclic nucleotide-binding domain-containing protein [Sulfitobacter geojensis]MBM1693747.1 cyclic nucleotide-binding domain-containing protein [Sulfitobacter geojensis]MBM1705913.1 cyclic nucleotide-binding domain-containing protein [Sulfitobacter geojensis]MBM1709971.1 cyclic nucleotide-binding domain-containing protein [Sulfitobacter geojensis]MBM1714037.1 cyclic nucleotide-binding domain-containi
MERSIFSFIWKYSRREQMALLAFTLFTFPFLYATLELPKRIINDAIGAQSEVIDLLGTEISQVQFLMVLCLGYLGAVLVHGLLKMRLNTMKGVLAERMLRRFRYRLINRMMRFPSSYFQNTSQGELVSMVTSEAEPMGGLMGDAVAQPVFQAGQMLIIVVFLFLQSVWFGLAGVALIPLQAWLIPRLQRQINLLNKERIKEVRQFASEIGETAAGITDLRTNGGWRYRLAAFTDRLGRLFDVRFRIYQKKFFMKFLNNFITQLTPFFFYAVGGYLAIKGEITVGALVAALAAYKDLSNPWKELLLYYNQTQDMALRWEVVNERFAPSHMIDKDLFEGEADEIPHLHGDIELANVSVRNASGDMVLRNISLNIPAGSKVALQVGNQTERTLLSEVLTREINPTRGQITIAGQDLAGLHQAVVAARIGYAQAQPYLFQGNVGSNLLMPLRTSPKTVLWDPKHIDRATIEARRSGNSPDSTRADWLDPEIADLNSVKDVHNFWYDITEALGTADEIFDRMLDAQMDPEKHPELARRIVALRGEVHRKLVAQGLDKAIYRFDPDKFNPAVPLGGNLMFAAPRRDISQVGLAAEHSFLAMVIDQGLAEQGIAISQTLVEMLHRTFGRDGTDHPLFIALGIEEPLYEQLVDIAQRRRDKGDQALSTDEFALLLTVPFAFTAEQIGPAFPESFKQEILRIRKAKGPQLREQTKDMFVPIEPDNYLPRLTILENLLYGRFSAVAGLQADLVRDVVTDILAKHDMKRLVSQNLFDVPTTIGGSNLPAAFQQRAAFGRAVIKRPDVLVLNQLLVGKDAEAQARIRDRLSILLPQTTQIYIDDTFAAPQDFDMHVEINNGQIDGVETTDQLDQQDSASDDLRRKLRIIARNDLFASLDRRHQRLLAFAAQWYTAEAGQRIFSAGDRADAAYLCLSGLAELGHEDEDGIMHHVSDVAPGRLIGDLAVILDEPRQLHLVAAEEVRFLRIGAEQFRSVIESDRVVLLSLLRTVAGHLAGAADVLIASGVEIPREMETLPRGDTPKEV